MAYRVENIIQGAAHLWMSPRVIGGTAVEIPGLIANESAEGKFESDGKWTDVGYTSDGVEVEFAPEFTDVEVDQLLDAAVIFKTKQTVTVKTTMAEATLENLMFVWGLQDEALLGEGDQTEDGVTLDEDEAQLNVDGGALNSFPGERQLAFVGSAPRAEGNVVDKERLYYLRRILQTDSSSHSLKRAEATNLPVSFRCLPDSSFTGAGYGFIRDRKVT